MRAHVAVNTSSSLLSGAHLPARLSALEPERRRTIKQLAGAPKDEAVYSYARAAALALRHSPKRREIESAAALCSRGYVAEAASPGEEGRSSYWCHTPPLLTSLPVVPRVAGGHQHGAGFAALTQSGYPGRHTRWTPGLQSQMGR